MIGNLEVEKTNWVKLWKAINAKGDPLPPFLDLKKCYAEPQRKYHVWKHITDGLEELKPAEHLAHHPNEIRMAYYFHDAIFDTRVKDSENVEKSAELAVAVMKQAQLPTPMVGRVADLVLVTKHNTPPVSTDAQIIVDIDFSILGKPEAEFDEYERNIRQEYAWVEEQVFRSTRAGILERFLARPRLYNTPFFLQKYEDQARRNLQRSISNLKTEST